MRQNLRSEGALLSEKDHPVIGRYRWGKQLCQRDTAPDGGVAGMHLRRKKRIVQRPDEPVLFTVSEPLRLLQKARMIRTIRLHKLTISNRLVKRGEVIEIKVEKGSLSRFVLGKRKFSRMEGFAVLAAAVIAPPVVPVINMQILF